MRRKRGANGERVASRREHFDGARFGGVARRDSEQHRSLAAGHAVTGANQLLECEFDDAGGLSGRGNVDLASGYDLEYIISRSGIVVLQLENGPEVDLQPGETR